MNWRSATIGVVAVVLLALAGSVGMTEDAAAGKGKVSLWIFERNIRAAAPGIEKVIALSDDQKKALEKVYNEVFAAEAVQAASKVLQDREAKLSQRQEAAKAIREARASFLKRCNAEVFTPEQNELVKKVYAAYNEVRTAAQRELAAKIVNGFSQKLGGILTDEQKANMEKAKAEIAAALEKRKREAAAKE